MDCKIVDRHLKKSPKQHGDGWDTSNKVWTHMIFHLSHTQGVFGVTFNDITKDTAFYTTTSRFVTWFGDFSQELFNSMYPLYNLSLEPRMKTHP